MRAREFYLNSAQNNYFVSCPLLTSYLSAAPADSAAIFATRDREKRA